MPPRVPLRLGVQAYSLGAQPEPDLAATFAALARIGYREVEMSFLQTVPPAVLRRLLDDAGLVCPSVHLGFSPIEESIAFAHQLGARFLVAGAAWKRDPSSVSTDAAPASMPWFLAVLNNLTLDDYKWNADNFNRAAEAARAAGLRFAYHNHNFDFKTLDGAIAYDELLRLTDPSLVSLELDCGWIIVAGFDPVSYLTRFPTRCRLLHIRDFAPAFPVSTTLDPAAMSFCVPPGQGSLDYRPILAAARAANVEHFFLEQEPTLAGDALIDSLQSAYASLQAL